ncbi:MAG: Fpg/Nei family DNA glycosylase [Solirubrobacteraceae bacterium]
MPEGDTIHHAALRIRPVLEGRVPDRILTPHPRHGAERWPERLAGRCVTAVEAYGKHLFLRFEGDLALHSHLRMTGSWGVYAHGQRWRRAPRRAWLVLHAGDRAVVQFDGPVLELMTAARSRADVRLAALGPDILGERFDTRRVLARLREDDPTRGIGDALLDQHIVAGLGNIWKAESCFAAALDPWRPLAEVRDEQLQSLLAFAREQMGISAREGYIRRPRAVYRRAGELCGRCGARIRSRGQGDDNRTTYWCPGCQRG